MKLYQKYKYLGYDKETISKCRFLMDKDNVITVKSVSVLLMIVLIVLIFFYSIFDHNALRNVICVVSVILMIGVYALANHMLTHTSLITPRRSDLLIDTLTFLCFSVGIYLGTWAMPDEMAVAPVWMFFFAILIFNCLPLQNSVVLLLAGGIFLVCSFLIKDSYHFQYDAMHAITSITASVFMSWPKSRMKVQNILALYQLQNANLQILETVEEQSKEAEELRYKADIDQLSGFYKKESFEEIVGDILKHSMPCTTHALVCCDIDNFKNINDSFGHLYGDKVLKEIVDIMNEELDAVFGRFGGDEFMMLVRDIDQREKLVNSIQEMEAHCKRTYHENGVERQISLSTGISWYPENGCDYLTLFQKADDALYENKRRKKHK